MYRRGNRSGAFRCVDTETGKRSSLGAISEDDARQIVKANSQPHDVPVLVSARLLKPLGNPLPNGVKYFATVELLELMQDQSWLAKVTNAVTQHWQNKNQRKNNRTVIEIGAAVGS